MRKADETMHLFFGRYKSEEKQLNDNGIVIEISILKTLFFNGLNRGKSAKKWHF